MFWDTFLSITYTFICIAIIAIIANILQQLTLRNANEPPVVFHWLPVIGSTVTYGIDPFKFFFACQKKYGDIFTFILLGRKVTVYLGPKGNQFILNGKLKDINAEEIYSVLTTPIFGKGVVYDIPNAKFMEQKKFIKSGLATEALRSYIPLMEEETRKFVGESPEFQGTGGAVQLPPLMAQITIFTASRTLQGKEVREKLDTTFAELYHALDDGFQPINFMLPWFPLPANRRRDIAQRKMVRIYADIISSRRHRTRDSEDMLWSLMDCTYKDGSQLSDSEIAGLMIALLMAGQHSSSVSSSWTMLRLAANPHIAEDLYKEQCQVFGAPDGTMRPLDHESLTTKCPLLTNAIRETLRFHPSIHSIMRKVKNPLPVPDSHLVVPPKHVLLASPAWMGKSSSYFPDADSWDPYRWEKIPDPKDMEREKTDYGYGLVSTGSDSTYLPFGAGRHRCIGEAFAMTQLSVIVSSMVREFKFSNVEGKKAGEVVETDYSSMFARPLEPAFVRWERRKGRTIS